MIEYEIDDEKRVQKKETTEKCVPDEKIGGELKGDFSY